LIKAIAQSKLSNISTVLYNKTSSTL